MLRGSSPLYAPESLTITGPSGQLEGLLERPLQSEIQATAVVCHPHPLHGGTMRNKVVATLARTLSSCGILALRFNFRGVGESAGQYADGLGELDDALAAVRWIRSTGPPSALLYLAGFSFGGAVALRAAARVECHGLISVAPAIGRVPETERLPSCPWLIVQGDADDIVACDDVLAWAARYAPHAKIALLQGAGHFFHGRLDALREHVQDFAQGAMLNAESDK